MRKKEIREVTDKEKAKMNSLAEDLIKKRGEVIHWMSEIESLLDELIVYNIVKKEQGKAFFDILLEDIKFYVKIKMFEIIKLHLSKEFDDKQKELVKELKELSTIRNKFAHQLSLINLDEVYLIGKGKPYKVDDKVFEDFKGRAIDVLAGLKYILLTQHGVSIKPGKMMWIPIDKIKSEYDVEK